MVLTRRHTRFIERDLPGIVNQAIGKLAEMRTQQSARLDAYKQTRIRDRTAHDLTVVHLGVFQIFDQNFGHQQQALWCVICDWSGIPAWLSHLSQ